MPKKKKASFGKILALSVSNIWRNKVLSLATIFVIAIILFIFNVILSVNFIANDSLAKISEKIDIVVYLKDSAEKSELDKLMTQIETLEGVTATTFTSKEKALESLKTTHPNLTLAFEKYNLTNPLPQSINISTTHPAYHNAITNFLKQEQFTRLISSITTDSENQSILNSISQNLMELSRFARQILFWIIATFLIGGALIIINALQITIYSRKKEIEVMKIIGASRSFIKLPFVIESIIYGTLAVIFCFTMMFLLSQNPTVESTSLFRFYPEIKLYTLFFAQLGFTLILCVLSSILAVQEHL